MRLGVALMMSVLWVHQDEHDVDESAYDAIRPRVTQLRREMQAHLEDRNRGEIIRSGSCAAVTVHALPSKAVGGDR